MKNIFRTLLVALLIVPCALLMVACKKDEKPQEATISSSYNETNIQNNINNLAEEKGGVFIKVKVTAAGEETSVGTICAYGRYGDLYYFEINGVQTIFDMSSDDYMIKYYRNTGDDKWTKDGFNYISPAVRERCQKQLNEYFETINVQFSVYAQFKNFKMTKTSAQIAGRDCDKFVLDLSKYASSFGSELGAALGEQTFYIDKETGACLKFEVSVTSQHGSASATFECLEFKTGYTITVPTKDEINK